MCWKWTVSRPALLGRPGKDSKGKTLPVSLLLLAPGYAPRGLLLAATATISTSNP